MAVVWVHTHAYNLEFSRVANDNDDVMRVYAMGARPLPVTKHDGICLCLLNALMSESKFSHAPIVETRNTCNPPICSAASPMQETISSFSWDSSHRSAVVLAVQPTRCSECHYSSNVHSAPEGWTTTTSAAWRREVCCSCQCQWRL